jgi:xanthine dehydrogenase accessory factor
MGSTKGSIILVRGAGDLATGVIARLAYSGFLVAALEIARPTAVRRTVSLSECMYDGTAEVEGVRAIRVGSPDELLSVATPRVVPVLEDPECSFLDGILPLALVDAIIAKRNLGTRISMAPIVIALGPGFTAGIDSHAVIETNRGHGLGRVILSGSAEPDTGRPGQIEGYDIDRVIRAPVDGTVEAIRSIGDIVERGEPVLAVRGVRGREIVSSPLAGVIRGMIRPGSEVGAGLKIGDVDPRGALVDVSMISDKARAIGGGVLEAVLRFGGRPS